MVDNETGPDPVARDVGHTAEVELLVRGATLHDLLGAAGRGLAGLSLDGPVRPGTGEWRRIEVQGADPAALLVNWLNELIYLAETERWVATEFRIERATDTAMTAAARGVKVDVPPSRVKAATFHGLEIVERNAILQAHVILDV